MTTKQLTMCRPQSIVDGLEAIDNNDDKVDYIVNILDSCGVITQTTTKKGKRKGKMSGYNCFTKTLYATEKGKAKDEDRKPMSYSDLLRMKTWSTLEEKQKTHWKGLAEQGCPELPIKE